jgi:tetratricopeptide (TPR) repeat protein
MKVRPMLAAILLSLSATAVADGPTTAASREIIALLNTNQLDLALEKAEAQVAANPKSAEAQYYYGAACGQTASNASMFTALGHAKRAKKAFEQAALLDPKSLDARFGLISYHLQAPGIAGGDKDEAKRLVAEVARISPTAGHRAQAMIYMQDENKPAALKEYQAALALDPADADSVQQLAGEYINAKQFALAEKIVAAGLAKAPASAKIRYQAGKLAATSGVNLAAGLAHLDAVLALKPSAEGVSLGGAQWRRGQILEKLARIPEAVSALEMAVKLEPRLKDAAVDLKRLRAQG